MFRAAPAVRSGHYLLVSVDAISALCLPSVLSIPYGLDQLPTARINGRPAGGHPDEATAEAGSAGARVLEAAALRALDGRTALVVAHRLTQAATADRIVVLDAGRVVEIARTPSWQPVKVRMRVSGPLGSGTHGRELTP